MGVSSILKMIIRKQTLVLFQDSLLQFQSILLLVFWRMTQMKFAKTIWRHWVSNLLMNQCQLIVKQAERILIRNDIECYIVI